MHGKGLHMIIQILEESFSKKIGLLMTADGSDDVLIK